MDTNWTGGVAEAFAGTHSDSVVDAWVLPVIILGGDSSRFGLEQ
jgi:hypothetical protein